MIAVSNETMRFSDTAVISKGVSGRELMARASKALFDAVQAIEKTKIVLFCGNGNNGGDGYALALLLFEHKYDFELYGQIPKSQDAKFYYDKCFTLFADKMHSLEDCVNLDRHIGIAIDCLYGSGYRGELAKETRLVTNTINNYGYVISCDIPSGLNGNNGLADKYAVRADLTVAIGSLKSGHLLNDGKDYSGEIIVADIGIPIIGEVYQIIDETFCLKCFPKRLNNTHKGSYGRVKIIACSESYVGAGILSASACINVLGETALKVGAGLCTLNVPDDMFSSMWQRVLHCTLEKRSKLTLGDSVIAYGMGVGESKILPKLLNQKMPLLIDADGLSELSANIELLLTKKCQVVLTPHPKEMSRLMGCDMQEILDSPIERAKSLAKKYNVVVLLKGCSTIVTDGEKVAIITKGTSAMAKGGSGDVLSGIIIGLIAKGNSIFDSACTGAYIAGYAGMLAEKDFSSDTVMAIDTSEYVKRAVVNIIKSK